MGIPGCPVLVTLNTHLGQRYLAIMHSIMLGYLRFRPGFKVRAITAFGQVRLNMWKLRILRHASRSSSGHIL